MNVGLIINIISLLLVIQISCIYFGKERINLFENKIYSVLLVSAIIGFSINTLCFILDMYFAEYILLRTVLIKFYYGYLLFFILSMTLYLLSSSDKEYYVKPVTFIYTLAIICSFILPLNFQDQGIESFLSGPNIMFVYIIVVASIINIIFYILINFEKIVLRKYIPLIMYASSSIIALILQYFFPRLLLEPFLISYVLVLMYHTIENPDVKMIDELEIAKNQAIKASRAKSDFLSSMSHEIRTPLNAIVGLSEDLLKYKDEVPLEVLEDAKDIQSASQTLLEIVGNILDINKIESNKMELTNAPYHPKKAISSVAKIVASRIADKPILFNLDIASNLPYELIGDKVFIKQIINNLLSNAIKYTEHGQIDLIIRCANEGEMCELSIIIKDTGCGIKKEDLPKMFKKFERLGLDKNSTIEGTGLGLSITKQLVDMMGGQITVQSELGRGSFFTVRVPQKISKMLGSNSDSRSLNQLSGHSDKVDYGHRKILLVDDNKLNIKVAKKALADFDFEIDEAFDGLECLKKIEAGNEYDLILMDIMMPNMNGEVAFERLKKKPNFKIPVIALTADSIAGARNKYIEEGFIDYIAKPFNKYQIKQKLDMVFKTEDKWDNPNVATYIFDATKEEVKD